MFMTRKIVNEEIHHCIKNTSMLSTKFLIVKKMIVLKLSKNEDLLWFRE